MSCSSPRSRAYGSSHHKAEKRAQSSATPSAWSRIVCHCSFGKPSFECAKYITFFPPRFYVLIISHKSGIRPPVYKNFLKIFCHSPFSRKDVHFRPAETDLLDAPAVFQKSPPPVPKPFPFCDNNSDPCENYFILPKPLPARGSHLISTYIYIL